MKPIEEQGLKKNIPDFGPGDTVKVYVKVVEGESERIQVFDGVVISKKGSGIGKTFTVRKISFGVGVERIFPLHSPRVEKIEVIKRGKVRRAKLYYLRELQGKAARLNEKEELRPAQTPEAAKPAETSTAKKSEIVKKDASPQERQKPEVKVKDDVKKQEVPAPQKAKEDKKEVK